MAKKLKSTRDKMAKLAKELEDKQKELLLTEEILKNEEQEEKERLQKVKDKVEQIGKEEDLFIGIVLTKEDVFHILSLMIEKQENVKIPAMVYYNE